MLGFHAELHQNATEGGGSTRGRSRRAKKSSSNQPPFPPQQQQFQYPHQQPNGMNGMNGANGMMNGMNGANGMGKRGPSTTRSMAHTFGNQSMMQPQVPTMQVSQARQVSPAEMLRQSQPQLQPQQQQQVPQNSELKQRMQEWRLRRQKQQQPQPQVAPDSQNGVAEDAFYTDDNPSDGPVPVRAMKPQTPTQQAESPATLTAELVQMRSELARLSKEARGGTTESSEVRNLKDQLQNALMEQNKLKEALEKTNISVRSMQSQLDTIKQDSLQVNDLNELEDTIRDEQEASLAGIETKMREALKIVSDQTFTVFGVVRAAVGGFSTPSLGGDKVTDFKEGEVILLNYPMQQQEGRVWMKFRRVSETATLSVGFVPLVDEDGNYLIGDFSVVPPSA